MATEKKSVSAGMAIDSAGGVAYDPSANVLSLVQAAVMRIDDMAKLRAELADEQIAGARREMASQEKIAILRADHASEIRHLEAEHNASLRRAESARLDSIRAVDREDVSKTAAQVLNSVNTLATVQAATAETLRNQVATTANQATAQRTTDAADFNKRLGAVELALSEGKGKQTVADPQMERMALMVEKLVTNQATGVGKGEGLSLSASILMGAITVIGGLLGIAGVLYAVLSTGTP